jgi:glycosyltransferase involved in cell wall biosynthesis
LKKILLIVDDIDSDRSGAIILRSLAKSINKTNFSCLILAPKSNLKTSYIVSEIENLEVIFFQNGPIKNINRFKRAINESLLPFNILRIKKIILDFNIDGIIYYSPSIFFGYAVKKLKKLLGVKSYLILRDIFPDWAVDHGLIKKGSIIEMYFNFFKKLNYQAADHIGVMSKTVLEKFVKNEQLYNTEVLPTWIDCDINIKSDLSFRSKYNLKDKVVFFYGGNIGSAQNISSLLNLAKKHINNKKVAFVFFGDGDEFEKVKKLSLNQENVLYFQFIENKKYNQIISSLDIGLLSLSKFHNFSNYPGKVINYMLLKKPVLGVVNNSNELMHIINKKKIGFICDYSDGWENKLYEYSNNLINNYQLLNSMGLNGYKYVITNHRTESIRDKILSYF